MVARAINLSFKSVYIPSIVILQQPVLIHFTEVNIAFIYLRKIH